MAFKKKRTKKMKHPLYITKTICTDGSTLNIGFPYGKSVIPLTTDLLNNSTYFSPKELIPKDSTQKVKKKTLQFDFYKLVK